jgi:hypothetical protein
MEGWIVSEDQSVAELLEELFALLEMDGDTPTVDVLVDGMPVTGELENERLIEVLYRLKELQEEYFEG